MQLAAVADRGELVGGAADDRGRHPRRAPRGASNLSSPAKLGKNSATTSNGVAVEHARRRTRRTPPAPRRRTRTVSVTTRGHVAAQPAHPVDERGGPRESVLTTRVTMPAAEPGRQQREQDPAGVEPAGRRRDQRDADDPVAEQLGVLLGQRDDRHAAHRVADQHDRAVAGDVVEDPLEVAARAARSSRGRRASAPSGRASAGRRRPRGPGRGRPRAGSASSRG